MTLREVLHAHIPTLTAESTVRDAVDKMDIYQFPGLVVVDDQERPIAVLTEGDLSRAVLGRGSVVQLTEEIALSFASKDPVTASPDLEISEALHLMLSRGLTLLPVEDQGRLYGLVLRVDLMQAMLIDAQPG